jgi:hypothetical protein
MALHACAHHDAPPLQHLEYEWRATRAYAQGKEFQVQQLIATDDLPCMQLLTTAPNRSSTGATSAARDGRRQATRRRALRDRACPAGKL